MQQWRCRSTALLPEGQGVKPAALKQPAAPGGRQRVSQEGGHIGCWSGAGDTDTCTPRTDKTDKTHKHDTREDEKTRDDTYSSKRDRQGRGALQRQQPHQTRNVCFTVRSTGMQGRCQLMHM